MSLIGIDFEMANGTPGSICAYGIAETDGSISYAVLALYPVLGGQQERTEYHGISPELTANGLEPERLYNRLMDMPEDTILVAHDARIDRRQLNAWCDMWRFPRITFPWLDTLKIAQRHFGKTNRNGVAAMAARMGMAVRPHDPVDDAEVALQIALRYDWKGIEPMEAA